jgi:carotenoid cleavage dioxygenase-like enzyme
MSSNTLLLVSIILLWSYSALPIVSSFTQSPKVDINFEKWVQDAPEEVTSPILLTVDGTIPSYVQGSLIRNGAAQWGTEKERYAHAFDGFAKITKYHIQDGSVRFSSKFVDSKWRRKAIEEKTLLQGLTTGPRMNCNLTDTLNVDLVQALLNSVSYDNVPVNIWGFEGKYYAITDAPARAWIDPNTLQTIQSAKPPRFARGANGYEMLSTAHPEYCKKGTGSTYNAIIELNPFGNRVSIVKETNEKDREIVASCIVEEGIPYIHSFGLTETKAFLLLQPLRLGLNDVPTMVKEGFMATMQQAKKTIAIVMDIETGKVLVNMKLKEPIYFYHSISCAELKTDNGASCISLKVCGYKDPDIITGDNMFFRFDRAKTSEGRNRISRGGKLCEVKIHWNDIHEPKAEVIWMNTVVQNKDGTQSQQGFELPTHRYSRWCKREDSMNQPLPWKDGKHPLFAYAYGAYANASNNYDTWNLLKINLETGEAISFRERDSCYYSEPIFVSDPEGVSEDDGVLLCQRYDGRNDSSSLLVICAKSMTLLAEAVTGIRNPMDFHGMYLKDDDNSPTLEV